MSKFQVSVVSDLFEAGRTEEGRPFIAERFSVQLVAVATGRRWAHKILISGVEVEHGDEGEVYFLDVRADAAARMERLAASVRDRLASGGRLDADFWVEVDPVYGSSEYVAQGVEGQRAAAERAAG